MSDIREPIIDPLIEELLGGQSPPDLKQQILQTYAASQASADEAQPDREVEKKRDSFPKVVARPRRPGRRPVNWRPWASAAIVLMGAGTFLAWYVFQSDKFISENRPPTNPVHVSPKTSLSIDPALATKSDENPQDSSSATSIAGQASRPIESPPEIDPGAYRNQESPTFERANDLGPVWPDEQIVRFTNDRLQAKWKEVSIRMPKKVDDRDWYVRSSRFLTGQDPSSAEVNSFLRDRDRERAVKSLLDQDEFSSTWSKWLTDMLVGEFPPDNQSFRREQLAQYLKTSLEEDKPYDRLVFELITALGSNDDNSARYNPAVNFLLAYQGGVPRKGVPHHDRMKVQATNIVCQLFLGKQIQCAQCHEHPSTKWSQDDYWQMAAFFVQMQAEDLKNGSYQLANRDFTGEQGAPERAELTFKRSDNETASVFPVFIDGQPAESFNGIAALFDRRESLAKFIVSSPDFAKATVNRLWDRAFGSGFTYPVDDIGDHKAPSHPFLMERLATEFRNSGYDLRSALRWITLCSAFEMPASPAAPSRLFDAYVSDTSAPKYARIENAIRRFADSDQELALTVTANLGKTVSEKEKTAATIRFNEKMQDELLATNSGNDLLRRIADNKKLSRDVKIDHLFLSILGRRPTDLELRQSRRLLKNRAREVSGLRDIGYVLISSKEFGAQH